MESSAPVDGKQSDKEIGKESDKIGSEIDRIPSMMLRSTTILRTAGRSLSPGRRRPWKSGKISIRAKSRRRTGTCLWTG